MPELFPAGTIWEKYPYLLPNLFSAATCVFGVVVGILFLEETHADKKDRHDPGLALGKAIMQRFTRRSTDEDDEEDVSETTSLLSHDEHPPRYQTTENSPQLTSTPATYVEDQPLLDAEVVGDRLREASEDSSVEQLEAKPSARKAFTKPVIMNIISYGILALYVPLQHLQGGILREYANSQTIATL